MEKDIEKEVLREDPAEDTAVEETSQLKKKSKKVTLITLVIVVLLVFGGGVSVYFIDQNNKRIEQEQIHNEEVYSVVGAYEKNIAENSVDFSVSDLDRQFALSKLVKLDELCQVVEAEQEAFKLYDGTLYKYEETLNAISGKVQELRNWFISGYQNTLDTNVIADFTAEGVTKDSIKVATEALNALEALVNTEKSCSIWPHEDDRAAFVAVIQSEADKNNTYITGIEAEEAAKKAALHVETDYFSFDIPESWGSNYTFTQTEAGDGNFFTAGTWVLTNNDKIPDIPFSGGSSSLGSNPRLGFDESAHSITIAVGRFMGFPFSSCDHSYQTAEFMGEVSFSEKLQVAGPKDCKKLWVYAKYPHKVGGHYSDQTISVPTKQQIDDGAYIMSTFVVK